MAKSEWEKADFNQRVKMATGEVVLAIGEGNFRTKLSQLFNAFQYEGYKLGFEHGKGNREPQLFDKPE